MGWYIQSDVNEGYPYCTEMPDTIIIGWHEPYPGTLWWIDPAINEGYPFCGAFPTTVTQGWSMDYPEMLWRIREGINEGYPFIAYWFDDHITPGGGGDMVIGGEQTNYPSGFTYTNGNYVYNDMDDTDMDPGTGVNYSVDLAVTGALSDKAFVVNFGELTQYLIAIASGGADPDDSIDPDVIQKLYGANVYNGLVTCKAFPFSLGLLKHYNTIGGGEVVGNTAPVKIFGKWRISAVDAHKLGSSMGAYWFNTITIEPKQAYEVESIDYSIYLPMAGVFPLDIRGKSDIDIVLHVSVLDGTGEYAVYINNQLYGTYKVQLASDIPIGFAQAQGAMQANFGNGVFTTVANAAGAVAGGMLGSLAGPAGIAAGINAGSSLGSALSTHYAVTTPQIGGIASAACYKYPRVIAKIPKMHKDGYGYHEILGANRSCTYEHLKSCSGFIQCREYKCDVIVATTDEKAEIERLMSTGVFL